MTLADLPPVAAAASRGRTPSSSCASVGSSDGTIPFGSRPSSFATIARRASSFASAKSRACRPISLSRLSRYRTFCRAESRGTTGARRSSTSRSRRFCERCRFGSCVASVPPPFSIGVVYSRHTAATVRADSIPASASRSPNVSIRSMCGHNISHARSKWCNKASSTLILGGDGLPECSDAIATIRRGREFHEPDRNLRYDSRRDQVCHRFRIRFQPRSRRAR